MNTPTRWAFTYTLTDGATETRYVASTAQTTAEAMLRSYLKDRLASITAVEVVEPDVIR